MIEEQSALERISGNLVTQIGLTLVATAAGTPLAAILPMLASSLAAKRHSLRVEIALNEINSILRENEEKLKELSDPQYKLLNELILTIMQNTEDAKINYLRSAIRSGIQAPDITQTIASQVSRALRDMTAAELDFVISHSESTIMIGPLTGDLGEDTYVVDRNKEEFSYFTGLIGLGVSTPAGSTINDSGRYVFAPFVKDLCLLIQ